MVRWFPIAFERKDWKNGKLVKSDGARTLELKLYDVLHYKIKPKNFKRRFNYEAAKDVYGLVGWEPDIPERETDESQTEKIDQLKKDFAENSLPICFVRRLRRKEKPLFIERILWLWKKLWKYFIPI